MIKPKMVKRCAWVNTEPLYLAYHDKEWGKPIYQSRLLFEFLNLEGMQAGLSWLTILKKRSHYRQVFHQFKAEEIVTFDSKKISVLLTDPGIIRNRLKIAAIINNAQAYLNVEEKYADFSTYIWQFVDGKPIQHHFKTANVVPTRSDISDKLSKDLKQKGFKFVGTTICYAFMQAVGMVNDHTQNCFRYKELLEEGN